MQQLIGGAHPATPTNGGTMEVIEHIAVLEEEGTRFASAARQSGLEVHIPTCPEWNMRDLVRHLSEIHLWAAARVAQRTDQLWLEDLSELTESWPDLAVFWPDDEDLIDWYLETNANLVGALRAAPSDLECPTFLPAPSPLAMWARRQAHETAVHRYDAANAVGSASGYDPSFASDGLDELLMGFAPRKSGLPVTTTRTMQVRAGDTGDQWHVTMGPDGITTFRGEDAADATLSGPASALYLALWNRGDDSSIMVAGDPEIVEMWHGNHRVTWS